MSAGAADGMMLPAIPALGRALRAGRGWVARRERAVDPLGGPLQAFAYDLRKVRADAGSPTYRALAKVAGYSATTLSEAAGGVRKPSLEVVLAYVGACRGDAELWRTRWEALPDPPTPATTPEPLDSPTAEPPPPAASARRRRPWKLVVPIAALLLVGGIGAVVLARRGDSKGCPGAVRHPAFTALTYGAGARVHTGAVRDAPVTKTIPSGCTVGFVGYCLGEKIHDTTGGTPDVRWFKLPDSEVVASGIVHGNPPPGLAPSRCTDDHPGPQAIALAVNGTGTLRLIATGTRLDIVGFAALFDPDGDQPAERRWRQVGFTEETADHPGFTARWKAVPSQDGKPVLLAAAACVGGDGPTPVVSARTVSGTAFPATALSTADQTSAAAAACSYPP
ncbi:helix-turn-helix domain-containing protein [Paractinoplanes globisporus]|uniref:Helix-turn-helix domain-containing protein n=1 Tax=Paractinoplanes globisporus TaxID=113565 RepID=A0ABW6W8K7_9ACTN|nr:helix-turn-helix transcriptional regulator [Actinoplanes globisporus]